MASESGRGLGGAAPEAFSPQHVASLLVACNSPDNQQRVEAENNLREMGLDGRFYSSLLCIAKTEETEWALRQAAVVMLKNMIRENWQNLDDGLKKAVRECLMGSLTEGQQGISKQYCICIARIASYDFPSVWPDVISELLKLLQSTHPVEKSNATKTLRYVVKNLDEDVLVNCLQSIMPFLLKIFLLEWRLSMEQILAETASLTPEDVAAKGPALLGQGDFVIGCFRLFLTLYEENLFSIADQPQQEDKASTWQSKGKVFVADEKAIRQLVQQMICSLPQFDGFRKNVAFLEKNFEKMMVLVGQTLLIMLEKEPLDFRCHLPLSLQTFYQFLASRERRTQPSGELNFEKFCISSLTFFHDVINTHEYRTPDSSSSSSSDPDEQIEFQKQMEAAQHMQSFFSPVIVNDFCRRLVSMYMIMSESDLVLWTEDPEELVQMELDSWQEKARPCAETLFTSLVRRWPEVCAPTVLEYLTNINEYEKGDQDPSSSQGMTPILRRDAIYNAVALAGFELSSQLSFHHLFTQYMAADLHRNDPRYRIVRRRIAVVIENWFCLGGVEMKEEDLQPLYSTLACLLRPEEDLVARIWGAIATRNVVLEVSFQKAPFLPFVPEIFRSLIQLVSQLSSGFIHIQILDVVSRIVKELGQDIKEITGSLIEMLNRLWATEDATSDLLKANIIRSLKRVVKASGAGFVQFTPVVQAIGHCLEGENDNDGLLEDGLRLWLCLMMNIGGGGGGGGGGGLTEEVVGLVRFLPGLVDVCLSSVNILIHILLHYVSLGRGGEGGMGRVSGQVFETVVKILDGVTPRVSVDAMVILHISFLSFLHQISSSSGGGGGEEGDHISSFRHLLILLVKRTLTEKDDTLRAHYLLFFSRIFTLHPPTFWSLFSQDPDTLSQLLSTFSSTNPLLLPPRHARLFSLGCLQIYTNVLQNDEMKQRFGRAFQELVGAAVQRGREGGGDEGKEGYQGVKGGKIDCFVSDVSVFIGGRDPVVVAFEKAMASGAFNG